MKEESLAHICLYQDTITAAKKMREICIDIDSRNKGITVSSAGADTVTSYAGSLSRCSINVNHRVMMGKCKLGRHLDFWHHYECPLRY